jgi:regulator of protease activity HflC (stomatin/prohibitin superfamily)
MKLYEWLTLLAIVIGPLVAVGITLWIESRSRKHDQRVVVLRLLIATRHVPADPGFLAAINLIPIEFNDVPAVITAYNEFIVASGVKLDGHSDEQILQNTATKLTRLIFEISRSLGFKLRETDIQTTAYASDGWVKRDLLTMDSQRAMRDIANILWSQTRLMRGESPDQVFTDNPTVLVAEETGQKAKKK